MMRSQGNRTSRRSVLAMTVATAATTAMPVAARQDGGTPAAGATGRVDAPHWAFEMHQLQDPYAGALQVPAAPPPGMRVIAAEVEVTNDSDQPLAFTPIDVRIRDEAGVEYRGGSAIGAEPTINPRNMNPGERVRGWVWFLVDELAQPLELVYVAPQPQFRVVLE